MPPVPSTRHFQFQLVSYCLLFFIVSLFLTIFVCSQSLSCVLACTLMNERYIFVGFIFPVIW